MRLLLPKLAALPDMDFSSQQAGTALAAESDPGAALGRINALLEAHNPQNMFVTLFLALY